MTNATAMPISEEDARKLALFGVFPMSCYWVMLAVIDGASPGYVAIKERAEQLTGMSISLPTVVRCVAVLCNIGALRKAGGRPARYEVGTKEAPAIKEALRRWDAGEATPMGI